MKECQKLAPYTLGISGEACQGVGGTWCRRPCTKLQQCVQNKPQLDKCRIAARYEIKKDAFTMTNSGKQCDLAGDEIYLTVNCTGGDGNHCRLPQSLIPQASSESQRALFDFTQTQYNESSLNNLAGMGNLSTYYQLNDTLSQTNTSTTLPTCEDATLNFTLTLTFGNSGHSGSVQATKNIIRFIKARNGIQTDLYPKLDTDTNLSYGSTLEIVFSETLQLCSSDTVHNALIVLELVNANFNEAFNEFSEELIITDASDEATCGEVRNLLGFDKDYIDDNEICREFYDLSCEFDSLEGSFVQGSGGGKIPEFIGFNFNPISFDGFDFQDSEFVGFEFEGFGRSDDLSFQEVQEVEMDKKGERECA